MFGIFYSLMVGIGAFGYSIKKDCENIENKKKYRSKDGLYYTDTKGRTKLISDDKIVHFYNDQNGDYVLGDAYGHVYKNYSLEQRNKIQEERIQRAIEKGKTVYSLDSFDYNSYVRTLRNPCIGRRYVDFKTNDIYVIREFDSVYYYMNVSTGKIVRRTDRQIDFEKMLKTVECPKGINIDEFNLKHEKEMENMPKDHKLWDYTFYLNFYSTWGAEEP